MCVQPATVILLSLLCACYHVDDVHSTCVNFIIIIIVLNSNLLNNICHICHLVFCQPHRASRERMHRPQNWLGCYFIWCSKLVGLFYLYPNENRLSLLLHTASACCLCSAAHWICINIYSNWKQCYFHLDGMLDARVRVCIYIYMGKLWIIPCIMMHNSIVWRSEAFWDHQYARVCIRISLSSLLARSFPALPLVQHEKHGLRFA